MALSFVLVLSSCAILTYCFWPQGANEDIYAYVYISAKLTRLDNKSDYIDLTKVTTETEYTIQGKESGDEGKMIITVKPGEIGVTYSGCSNQFCVKQGYISKASQTIICAPNELLITLKGVTDTEITV